MEKTKGIRALLASAVVKAADTFEFGIIISKKGITVFSNEYLTRLTGFSPEYLLDKSPRVLIHPDDLNKVATLVASRKEPKGYTNKYDSTVVDANGGNIPVKIYAFPIAFKGEIFNMSIITDQSQMQQYAQSLEVAKNKYETLFNDSPICMLRFSKDGQILEYNARARKLVKKSVGENIFNLFSSRSKQQLSDGLKNNFDQLVLELETIRNFNSTKFVEITIQNSGSSNFYEAAITDITDRKNKEKIIESRNTFREVIGILAARFMHLSVEDLDEGIRESLEIIGNQLGVECTFINLSKDTYLTALPYYIWFKENTNTENYLKNISRDKSMPSLYKNLVEKGINKIEDVDTDTTISDDDRKILQSGDVKSVLSVPLISEGKRLGVFGCIYLTRNHRWTDDEILLMHIASEIFAGAIVKREMDSKIHKLYENQANLFSQVAHSLKTPLAVIVSNLEILKTVSNTNKDTLIRNTQMEIKSATNIINQLLHIAKMEILPGQINSESNPISPTLKSTYQKSLRVFKSRTPGATLKIAEQYIGLEIENKINVKHDPEALVQALLLIIDNAIHHSKHGNKPTKVYISGKKDKKGKYIISITDKGKGIAESEVPYLFDLFYQGRRSKEGTGIGLAFAKKLIESQGGDIEIKSKEGKGTTVNISLEC